MREHPLSTIVYPLTTKSTPSKWKENLRKHRYKTIYNKEGGFNVHTGWSINNRTILNCSHFIARQYFFTPFSPKWSIHTGKLPQQHEFANASFVILIRCHFVSPYHVDGSANNVLCRAGHFCEIAGVPAHLVSSQVQLEQENSLNSLKRYPKTAWPEWPRHFEIKEWFWSEARPAGRRPWQRMKKGDYWNCLSSRAPSPSRASYLEMEIERAFFCSNGTFKNSMRVSSSDFPEMTASIQSDICWTAHIVRWNKVARNQNNRMMPWRTNVAVIICQCVYSTWVKTDWKNIAWLKNGSSLKSFYYLWTTRYQA